jgi:hypothetical protein
MVSIILTFYPLLYRFMGYIILILNFGFPCLLLCLSSLPAFVPSIACLCAFPCLHLCLSLPAFVPFLARLFAFVPLCNCFQLSGSVYQPHWCTFDVRFPN